MRSGGFVYELKKNGRCYFSLLELSESQSRLRYISTYIVTRASQSLPKHPGMLTCHSKKTTGGTNNIDDASALFRFCSKPYLQLVQYP